MAPMTSRLLSFTPGSLPGAPRLDRRGIARGVLVDLPVGRWRDAGVVVVLLEGFFEHRELLGLLFLRLTQVGRLHLDRRIALHEQVVRDRSEIRREVAAQDVAQ